MPRMLGMEYRWRDSRLWQDSLIYLGINAAVVLAVAALAGGAFFLAYFVAFFVSTAAFVAVLVVAAVLILAALFGVPSILLFVRRHRRETWCLQRAGGVGVHRGRAGCEFCLPGSSIWLCSARRCHIEAP